MIADTSGGLKLLKSSKCFGGYNRRYEYQSHCCKCPMLFTVFFPPAAEAYAVPVIYYLASLTTDDETFIEQAGAQRKAAELGVALVCSDNSPRNIPGVEPQGEWPHGWGFGYSASWYVNAIMPKWQNWQMRDWIAKELPEVLREHFCEQLNTRVASLMGFSMGGYGALTIGLTFPKSYRCISALAPVTRVDTKVAERYLAAALGDSPEAREAWKLYDVALLVKDYSGPHRDILVEMGSLDHFSPDAVDPEYFAAAAQSNPNVTVTCCIQENYGHSFSYVATFIDKHLEWHHAHLKR